MKKTRIEWCDSTWNPITGCLNNCHYCYARNMVRRFAVRQVSAELPELDEPIKNENGKVSPYPCGFDPTFHRYRLNEYINKKGRNIFVCSMADMFGDWISDEWITEIFEACRKAPQHNYLFLTKNPCRYSELMKKGRLPLCGNMWYGATVTDNDKLNVMGEENMYRELYWESGSYSRIMPKRIKMQRRQYNEQKS